MFSRTIQFPFGQYTRSRYYQKGVQIRIDNRDKLIYESGSFGINNLFDKIVYIYYINFLFEIILNEINVFSFSRSGKDKLNCVRK